MIVAIKEFYNMLIQAKVVGKQLIIGIDGGGGAGKSTLAKLIKDIEPSHISVVHMDDFYKPSKEREHISISDIAGYWDWKRVEKQVLLPLTVQTNTCYQRYDWNKDELAEWHSVSSENMIIIEGCYSLIKELRGYYDVKIWVESPQQIRLSRGINRDGEEKRYLWEDIWMPAEELYKITQRPFDIADIIIDGSGVNVDVGKGEILIKKNSIFRKEG